MSINKPDGGAEVLNSVSVIGSGEAMELPVLARPDSAPLFLTTGKPGDARVLALWPSPLVFPKLEVSTSNATLAHIPRGTTRVPVDSTLLIGSTDTVEREGSIKAQIHVVKGNRNLQDEQLIVSIRNLSNDRLLAGCGIIPRDVNGNGDTTLHAGDLDRSAGRNGAPVKIKFGKTGNERVELHNFDGRSFGNLVKTPEGIFVYADGSSAKLEANNPLAITKKAGGYNVIPDPLHALPAPKNFAEAARQASAHKVLSVSLLRAVLGSQIIKLVDTGRDEGTRIKMPQ